MAIVTATEIKTYLNWGADTSNDTFFERLAAEGQNKIETWCGQKLEAAALTRIFSGDGGSTYDLTFLPLNSITSISYRTDVFSSYTALTATDYTYQKINGINTVIYKYKFIEGWLNYKIIANVGFESGSMPYELKAVICEMASVALRDSGKGGGTLGISSKAEGGQTGGLQTNYADNWTAWRKRLLPYRKQTV